MAVEALEQGRGQGRGEEREHGSREGQEALLAELRALRSEVADLRQAMGTGERVVR